MIRNQQGVSLLGLMGIVAIMGVTLSAVGQHWSVAVKRDQEKELLFRGKSIRNAIEAYAVDYEVMKADRSNRYPRTLDQLTQLPKRYLPKVYKDPITGKDFDLIVVKGEIRGVRSTSTDWVMDIVNLKDAATYKDMLFQAQDPKQSGPPGLDQAGPVNPLNPLLAQPAAPPPPGGAPSPGMPPSVGPGGQPIVMP